MIDLGNPNKDEQIALINAAQKRSLNMVNRLLGRDPASTLLMIKLY